LIRSVLLSGLVNLRFTNPGDHVFMAGRKASHAYFLARGRLSYLKDTSSAYDAGGGNPHSGRHGSIIRFGSGGGTNHRLTQLRKADTKSSSFKSEEAFRSTDVAENTWLAEKTLWLNWRHLGLLESQNAAEVLAIDAESFTKHLVKDPEIAVVAMDYAKSCNRQLQTLRPHMVSDVDGNLDEHGLHVLCMDDHCRLIMSSPLLDCLSYQQVGRRLFIIVNFRAPLALGQTT